MQKPVRETLLYLQTPPAPRILWTAKRVEEYRRRALGLETVSPGRVRKIAVREDP